MNYIVFHTRISLNNWLRKEISNNNKGHIMILLSSMLLFACQNQSEIETPHSEPTETKKEEAHNGEDNHHDDHHPEGQVTPEPVVTEHYTDYGSPLSSEKVHPASTVLGSEANFVGQTIRVEGTAADVCQKAGCWIVLSDGEKTLRVTTKAHSFFVDKQGAGKKCEVEGVVISREKDPERTAHFESEAGENAPIPENEVEGNIYYEIEASGIRLYNSTL
jgi:hypothetical protein